MSSISFYGTLSEAFLIDIKKFFLDFSSSLRSM